MNTNKYFYIIEENIKNPKIFELNTYTYSDKYIRFNQNSLKNKLTKRSFKQLLKNGLFKTKKERKYNAQISFQRLVGCLYSDISDLDMHHINKDKSDNRFVNLVPLKSEINKSIDSLPIKEMIEYGKLKQDEWVQIINKKNRNTLANNDLLVYEILSKSLNVSAKETHRTFKDKIKSIKVIYKILNTFFYKEEFLKYLKNNRFNNFKN